MFSSVNRLNLPVKITFELLIFMKLRYIKVVVLNEHFNVAQREIKLLVL